VFSTHCALCFSFLQRDFRIKPAHHQTSNLLLRGSQRQSMDTPPSEGGESTVERTFTQRGGATRAELRDHIAPSTGKRERVAHSGVTINRHPQLGRTEHPVVPLRVLPNYSKTKSRGKLPVVGCGVV